jgi:hypothetical protein
MSNRAKFSDNIGRGSTLGNQFNYVGGGEIYTSTPCIAVPKGVPTSIESNPQG